VVLEGRVRNAFDEEQIPIARPYGGSVHDRRPAFRPQLPTQFIECMITNPGWLENDHRDEFAVIQGAISVSETDKGGCLTPKDGMGARYGEYGNLNTFFR